MKSFAIGPIVCALLSWVGPSSSYRIQEQSQGRFVPAPFGEFPQCRIYGRTYCLDAPGYPIDLIEYLLHHNMFNLSTIFLNEGDPTHEAVDLADLLKANNDSLPEAVEAQRPMDVSAIEKTADPIQDRRDAYDYSAYDNEDALDQEESEGETTTDGQEAGGHSLISNQRLKLDNLKQRVENLIYQQMATNAEEDERKTPDLEASKSSTYYQNYLARKAEQGQAANALVKRPSQGQDDDIRIGQENEYSSISLEDLDVGSEKEFAQYSPSEPLSSAEEHLLENAFDFNEDILNQILNIDQLEFGTRTQPIRNGDESLRDQDNMEYGQDFTDGSQGDDMKLIEFLINPNATNKRAITATVIEIRSSVSDSLGDLGQDYADYLDQALEDPLQAFGAPLREPEEPISETEEPILETEGSIQGVEESMSNFRGDVQEAGEPMPEAREHIREVDYPAEEERVITQDGGEPTPDEHEIIQEVGEPTQQVREVIRVAGAPIQEARRLIQEVGVPTQRAEEPLQDLEEVTPNANRRMDHTEYHQPRYTSSDKIRLHLRTTSTTTTQAPRTGKTQIQPRPRISPKSARQPVFREPGPTLPERISTRRSQGPVQNLAEIFPSSIFEQAQERPVGTRRPRIPGNPPTQSNMFLAKSNHNISPAFSTPQPPVYIRQAMPVIRNVPTRPSMVNNARFPAQALTSLPPNFFDLRPMRTASNLMPLRDASSSSTANETTRLNPFLRNAKPTSQPHFQGANETPEVLLGSMVQHEITPSQSPIPQESQLLGVAQQGSPLEESQTLLPQEPQPRVEQGSIQSSEEPNPVRVPTPSPDVPHPEAGTTLAEAQTLRPSPSLPRARPQEGPRPQKRPQQRPIGPQRPLQRPQGSVPLPRPGIGPRLPNRPRRRFRPYQASFADQLPRRRAEGTPPAGKSFSDPFRVHNSPNLGPNAGPGGKYTPKLDEMVFAPEASVEQPQRRELKQTPPGQKRPPIPPAYRSPMAFVNPLSWLRNVISPRRRPTFRQGRAMQEFSCPTRKLFIHPRVAFSVKGQWMYIVNIPQGQAHQRILTEQCLTKTCQRGCDTKGQDRRNSSCELQFVQKRLVALSVDGRKLVSELFWIPSTCKCQTENNN